MKDTLKQEYLDLVNPIVVNYKSDIEYDLEALGLGIPSLFIPRENGTHSETFHPFESYPDKFSKVPYLFSSAGRGHILSQVGTALEHDIKESNAKIVIHFTGDALEVVDVEKARSLVAEYKLEMQEKFDNDNGVR